MRLELRAAGPSALGTKVLLEPVRGAALLPALVPPPLRDAALLEGCARSPPDLCAAASAAGSTRLKAQMRRRMALGRPMCRARAKSTSQALVDVSQRQ
jgi:hypothetical protein